MGLGGLIRGIGKLSKTFGQINTGARKFGQIIDAGRKFGSLVNDISGGNLGKSKFAQDISKITDKAEMITDKVKKFSGDAEMATQKMTKY